MDKYIEKMTRIFSLLSDNTRLKIILYLQEHKEECVSTMTEALGLTQSNLSHQLALLKGAGLVTYRKDGRKSYYRLDDEHVEVLIDVALSHVKHQ